MTKRQDVEALKRRSVEAFSREAPWSAAVLRRYLFRISDFQFRIWPVEQAVPN
jgi:hypothetical protein